MPLEELRLFIKQLSNDFIIFLIYKY